MMNYLNRNMHSFLRIYSVADHFSMVVYWVCWRRLRTYVQEPLAKGRRGCTGRDLNEKMLAADNGRWQTVKEVSRV